ncbi:MAG TPA: pyridoxal phosphate-dependent aminotransferase family protein [Leeuwenhoekiella sp.]|nr:pyridoxal phosphate-dependent aminotransferase family protein [Leeuwenhoekiella sp.]
MAFYVKKVPGRSIAENGTEYLYFGGTSYLGLQNHPGFEALLLKNIKTYGMSHGASRKSNVRLAIYEEAESHMSQWTGAEAAMLVSSGYLAGQLLRDYFDEEDYSVFHMPNAHSALSRKSDKYFTTLVALKTAIEQQTVKTTSKTVVLFFDTVSFSSENYPDFEFLKALPLAQIILVADDSHGIGILGKNGAGVFRELLQLRAKELFLCASLSKGPTVQAGVILGTAMRVKNLKNSLHYGGSSPASPASVATLVEAGPIYSEQREKLVKNTNLFVKSVKNASFFKRTVGHPAFNYYNTQLTEFLEEHAILVTHFSYPNPDAAVLSRIVISAGHTTADIKKLSALINQFLAENV